MAYGLRIMDNVTLRVFVLLQINTSRVKPSLMSKFKMLKRGVSWIQKESFKLSSNPIFVSLLLVWNLPKCILLYTAIRYGYAIINSLLPFLPNQRITINVPWTRFKNPISCIIIFQFQDNTPLYSMQRYQWILSYPIIYPQYYETGHKEVFCL